jgi:hypothetical protein
MVLWATGEERGFAASEAMTLLSVRSRSDEYTGAAADRTAEAAADPVADTAAGPADATADTPGQGR